MCSLPNIVLSLCSVASKPSYCMLYRQWLMSNLCILSSNLNKAGSSVCPLRLNCYCIGIWSQKGSDMSLMDSWYSFVRYRYSSNKKNGMPGTSLLRYHNNLQGRNTRSRLVSSYDQNCSLSIKNWLILCTSGSLDGNRRTCSSCYSSCIWMDIRHNKGFRFWHKRRLMKDRPSSCSLQSTC